MGVGCCCTSLPDLAVVGMGTEDRLDQRVFTSLQRTAKYGGYQWWLYVSTCCECGQNWMVAQDERIYDNFYLRRITPSVRDQIVKEGRWPEEFLTYERVLALGRAMSPPPRFLNPRSPALLNTVADLWRERQEISPEQISYLLGMHVADVVDILQNEISSIFFRKVERHE